MGEAADLQYLKPHYRRSIGCGLLQQVEQRLREGKDQLAPAAKAVDVLSLLDGRRRMDG